MKKSFLAFLFCLIVTFMFAQKSSAEKAEMASNRMEKILDLTAQQKTAIKAAYQEMYTANAALKNSASDSKAEEHGNIRSNFDKSIADILTDEQNDKWAGKTKGNGAKKQIKNPASTPAERIHRNSERAAARMTRQLDLSDAQKKQVYEASKKKQTATEDIRSNKEADHSQLIEDRRNINDEYKASIESILTDEQKDKRTAIRQTRMDKNKKSNGRYTNGSDQKMEVGERKILKNQKVDYVKKTDTDLEQQAAAYTEKMTTKIGLTAKQVNPFNQAYLKRISYMDAIKKDDTVTDKQKAKKAILDDYEVSLTEILTSEQQQKMSVLKKKRTVAPKKAKH